MITLYEVGDKAEAAEVKDVKGRIIKIQISNVGTEYQLRYFDGVEQKFAWFFEDEILVRTV